ncbi:PTS sugar transporter subunit IIA [Enterococcus gallinarum]|uniref:PTS sugar transporter subunit IIA n=1 Tax=Enterococcus gallinarum TaxID=1353 RepID=UPI0012E32319|nr:PTS glucose transporter subunit IIA [Enterococcus gallinarum]MUN91215.1 PTS glucose transporter subunit IIA [Enterococcus gallinarum]
MFFSKKKWVLAPAAGNVLPIDQVKDDVFSSKMMGGGFAITDHNGKIFAPITGSVVDVFPTKHAITLKTESGAVVLVHMGLDTVEMEGNPFTILVEKGQEIRASDPLALMDIRALASADKDSVLIVVLVEDDGVLQINRGQVNWGEKLFYYQ